MVREDSSRVVDMRPDNKEETEQNTTKQNALIKLNKM